MEKIRTEGEKSIKGRDAEITALKKKIVTLEKAGVNAKKLNEMKQTYTDKITGESSFEFQFCTIIVMFSNLLTDLQKEVKSGAKLYDDLNVKYGVLGDSRAHLESENTILKR